MCEDQTLLKLKLLMWKLSKVFLKILLLHVLIERINENEKESGSSQGISKTKKKNYGTEVTQKVLGISMVTMLLR